MVYTHKHIHIDSDKAIGHFVLKNTRLRHMLTTASVRWDRRRYKQDAWQQRRQSWGLGVATGVNYEIGASPNTSIEPFEFEF